MASEAGKKRLETPDESAAQAAPACRPGTGATRTADSVAQAVSVLVAVAGLLAVTGLLPATAAATVLAVLFWLWTFSAVVNTAQLLVRARIPRDERSPGCDRAGRWPRVTLVQRLLWRTLLVVLLVYRHYGLAALLGYGIALGIASRVETRLILGEIRGAGPVSCAVHRVLYALAERLAPVYEPLHRLLTRRVGGVPLAAWLAIVPLFPIFAAVAVLFLLLWLLFWLLWGLFNIPLFLLGFVRERAGQRGLVRAASAAGTRAWFAYAEPHQRERFMGEGGVLHGMGDALIVRDWRRDLGDAGRGDGRSDLDALIVERFGLSNMREDLPVLVLLQPDGRLHPIRLNRAYRQRFRDGGDLLAALEDAIRDKTAALRRAAA